jgi:hypothetical protein
MLNGSLTWQVQRADGEGRQHGSRGRSPALHQAKQAVRRIGAHALARSPAAIKLTHVKVGSPPIRLGYEGVRGSLPRCAGVLELKRSNSTRLAAHVHLKLREGEVGREHVHSVHAWYDVVEGEGAIDSRQRVELATI